MRGLQGHLRLICARDARGRNHLREQSFRAPMHISKPYEDAGMLMVNVVNPTAGLLEGDAVDCEVAVEAGARLFLTAPSASRVHRMRAGCAAVRQKFQVDAGAVLDVFPELFIPQASSRYTQQTVVRVAGEGTLLLTEMIAPGRVAAGEAFAYHCLHWETAIHSAESLLARERFTLEPAGPAVEAMRRVFPEAYYASLYAISPPLLADAEWCARVDSLQSASLWIGVSRLRSHGFVIKLLASGSLELRKAVRDVRTLLYEVMRLPPPALRRAGDFS